MRVVELAWQAITPVLPGKGNVGVGFRLQAPRASPAGKRCDRVPGRDSRAAHLRFLVTWGRIQQLVCRLCICTSTTTTIRLSEPSPSCTQLFCRAVSRLLPGRDIVLGRQCHGKTIAVVVVVITLAYYQCLLPLPLPITTAIAFITIAIAYYHCH